MVKLVAAIEATRGKSDLELSDNCGLMVIRRLLVEEPRIAVFLMEGALWRSTGGFAMDNPRDRLRRGAEAYVYSEQGWQYPEGVLHYLAKAIGWVR